MRRDELDGLLNLSEDIIPAGRRNRPGTRIVPVFVTMHNTANTSPGADAKAHARFARETGHYVLDGRKHWVSWHFTVDDARVIRHLPLDEKALHAGPANSVSVAVEVCMHRGIDTAAANLRAARLAAALLFDLGLGVESLRTHKSWTGKNCPALLLGHWQQFVSQVAGIRGAITGTGAMAARPARPGGEEAARLAVAAGAAHDEAEIDHDALAAAIAEQGPGS